MKNIDWFLNGLLSLILGLILILSSFLLKVPSFSENELVFITFLIWILMNQRNLWEED